MSMIVHVRWVGGVENIHVDKFGKMAVFEEITLNKTLLLFPSKNIDQNKTFLEYILRKKG